MGARSFGGRFGVEGIMAGCAKMAKQIAYIYLPKLIMPVWWRLIFMVADVVVYGPLVEKIWSSSMNESFFLDFVFTLIPHKPWRIRG